MENINEDLSVTPGTSGNIYDSDTNEPIAKYSKSYGKTYDVSWHPTFLAIHPQVKNSLIAADLLRERPTGKEGASNVVSAYHNRLAANGFTDGYNVEGDIKGTHVLKNQKTDEPILTRTKTEDYYKPYRHELHPDFVAKHNIQEPVKNTIEDRLNKTSKHYEMLDLLGQQIKEVSKKKTGVGLHSFGDGMFSTYHTEADPESASAEHEQHIRNKFHGAEITRLSPTSFIGKQGDFTIHSIAHDNQIHEIKTRTKGGSAKKFAFTDSF